MNARDKLNEFAEINGMDKNELIGWSIAADFAEWYAEQKALSQAAVSGSLPLPQHQAYQNLLMRIYNEFKSAEWVSPIVEEIKEHIVYPIQEDGRQ